MDNVDKGSQAAPYPHMWGSFIRYRVYMRGKTENGLASGCGQVLNKFLKESSLFSAFHIWEAEDAHTQIWGCRL